MIEDVFTFLGYCEETFLEGRSLKAVSWIMLDHIELRINDLLTKAQFSEAAMRIPKGDALRPSELFEDLEALKKSFQLNIKS